MRKISSTTRNPLPYLFLIPILLVVVTIILFAQSFDEAPATVTLAPAAPAQAEVAVPLASGDNLNAAEAPPTATVVYRSSDEGFSVQAARLLVVLTIGCVLAITFSLLYARWQDINARTSVRQHQMYTRVYDRVRQETHWRQGQLVRQPVRIDEAKPYHHTDSTPKPPNVIDFR